jgi:hypothetical protein
MCFLDILCLVVLSHQTEIGIPDPKLLNWLVRSLGNINRSLVSLLINIPTFKDKNICKYSLGYLFFVEKK